MRWLDFGSSSIGYGLTLGLCLTVACSDDGVPASTQSSSAGSATEGATATATASASGEGTSSDGDTADPSGITTTDTAGTTGSPGDTDGTSGTGTASGTDTDTDGTGTTGGMPLHCEVDADCVLVNDCCSCTAIHMDQMPPECDIDACLQSTCDAVGLPDAAVECRYGTCQLQDVECNQALVECDAPQPQCPEGHLPSVQNGCWTNSCVPAEACNVVPDCSWCEEGQTCVQTVLQLGATYSCEPVAPECAGVPACDCMPEVCGGDPFECADGGGNEAELSCNCPVCG